MERQTRPTNSSDNLSPDFGAVKETLSRRPEVQGWLLIGAAILLALYLLGIFTTLFNYVLLGIAAYLFVYGALKVHLGQKVSRAIEWGRSKFKRNRR